MFKLDVQTDNASRTIPYFFPWPTPPWVTYLFYFGVSVWVFGWTLPLLVG
jgi:hypothetical protein